MQIELLDGNRDKTFEIRTLNNAIQPLADREAGKFTEWIFKVMPLKEGTFPITIKAAVVEFIEGEKYFREIVLEEKVDIVTTQAVTDEPDDFRPSENFNLSPPQPVPVPEIRVVQDIPASDVRPLDNPPTPKPKKGGIRKQLGVATVALMGVMALLMVYNGGGSSIDSAVDPGPTQPKVANNVPTHSDDVPKEDDPPPMPEINEMATLEEEAYDQSKYSKNEVNQYKIKTINGIVWLAENLSVAVKESECISDCQNTGRFYTFAGAQEACQKLGAGWQVPSQEDWAHVFTEYENINSTSSENTQKKYEAFIPGGDSGFDAKFAGFMTSKGEIRDSEMIGYYWTSSTQGTGGLVYLFFKETTEHPGSIIPQPFDQAIRLSCRCVKK